MSRSTSWKNRTTRPLKPELRKLFEEKPPMPIVKFDPAFAAWQASRPPERPRNIFREIVEAIER